MNIYFASVSAASPLGYTSPATRSLYGQKPISHGSHHAPHKPSVSLTSVLSALTGIGSSNLDDEGTGEAIEISLKRASTASPWGFRVQGGADYKLQLTVCKTQTGSPSDGVLHKGDAILSINGQSTRTLSHDEATHQIKSSGSDLQLKISRRHGADLTDLKPKGQIKFTVPQHGRH